MAKKRKTREQKKLADQRHNFIHSLAKHSHSEAKITLENKESIKPLIKQERPVAINEYPYLVKDLSKTTLLTGAILTFQLILFFLLKNHIFTIPGLIY